MQSPQPSSFTESCVPKYAPPAAAAATGCSHVLTSGSCPIAGRLARGKLEFEVTLTRDSSPAKANCRSYAKLIAGSLHDDCLLLHEPVVLEHFPSPYTVKLATRGPAPPDASAVNIVASVVLDRLIGLDITKKVTVPRTAKLQQGSAVALGQQPDPGQRVTEPQQQQQQQQQGRSVFAAQQSKVQPQGRGHLLYQGTAFPPSSMQVPLVSAAHPSQPAPTSFAHRPQGAAAMPSEAGHTGQQHHDKQLGHQGFRGSSAQRQVSYGGEDAAWQNPQDLCQGGLEHEAAPETAIRPSALGSALGARANMAASTHASGGSAANQPLASQHIPQGIQGASQGVQLNCQGGSMPTAVAGGALQKNGRTRRKLVHTISLPHPPPSSSGPADVKLHKPGLVRPLTIQVDEALQQVQNAASVGYRVIYWEGAYLGFTQLHRHLGQKASTT